MLKKLLITTVTISATLCFGTTMVHGAWFLPNTGSGYSEADVIALRNGVYTEGTLKVLSKTTNNKDQTTIIYSNGTTVTVNDKGQVVSDQYDIRKDTNYYFSTNGPYVAEAVRGVPTLYTMDVNGSINNPNFLPSGYYNVATDQTGGSGWRWLENGKLFTGFKYYLGAYYWFENGVRQNNKWETAWGNQYWVGNDGRAVQGIRQVDDFVTANPQSYDWKVDVTDNLSAGTWVDFGTNGTWNLTEML